IGHSQMELNFRYVGQLARTFLQQLKGTVIVAPLEQNPTQRVGYMRLVRGLFRFRCQVVCLIQLSELFRIENREVIKCERHIWRNGEQLLIGVAGSIEMLQLLLDRGELQEFGSFGRTLVILRESGEFFYRLFLPGRGYIELSEQLVCRL